MKIFFTAEGSTVKNQWSINGSFNSARIDILAGAFLIIFLKIS